MVGTARASQFATEVCTLAGKESQFGTMDCEQELCRYELTIASDASALVSIIDVVSATLEISLM